jgi:uncharacterized protein YneF (UPF0154 family)
VKKARIEKAKDVRDDVLQLMFLQMGKKKKKKKKILGMMR